MICLPNCKINLGLNIIGKRTDGYHNLETLFVPLPLSDVLEVIPAADGVFAFQSSGLNIPGGVEENLSVKAFRLLQSEHNLPEVKMHLHKVIPMGAGLGGGSSDGAAALKLISNLFNLALDIDQLKSHARLLGSDCSFFIENRPVFARERGDQFEPVLIDLSGFTLLLALPEIHVCTADAYSSVTAAIPEISLKNLVQLPPEQWKERIKNDFEGPVFKKHPEIKEIKQKMYDAGAVYASMSGSGSAVYGLFGASPATGDIFTGIHTLSFSL